MSTDPSVLAFGAHLKNRMCRWDGSHLIESELHGDLSDARACRAMWSQAQEWLQRTTDSTCSTWRPTWSAMAHDLHPDFASTECAWHWAKQLNCPALGVQHHHAHLAAVAYEHDIDEPMLGWALDGYGMGTDGQAWGGELLWVHGSRWCRLAHLEPLTLPGGDRSAREPWRMALAALHLNPALIEPQSLNSIPETARQAVRNMIAQRFNCPSSSSAGRWFDAMSALLGLCLEQDTEAQAPMALQAMAEKALPQLSQLALHTLKTRAGGTSLRHHAPNEALEVQKTVPTEVPSVVPSVVPMSDLVENVMRVAQAQGPAIAALSFHLNLAHGLSECLLHWRDKLSTLQPKTLTRVGLSGGCMTNSLLRNAMTRHLTSAGLSVHTLEPRGHGDEHVAMGQAWVARDWIKHHPEAQGFGAWRCDPLEGLPQVHDAPNATALKLEFA